MDDDVYEDCDGDVCKACKEDDACHMAGEPDKEDEDYRTVYGC